MQVNKKKNKKLIERYPFLMPHDRLTDEVPEDFDYSKVNFPPETPIRIIVCEL